MPGTGRRTVRRAVGILTALACTMPLLLASPAVHASSGRLRLLQMNLCDSGDARCYTGRAVTEAATVIHAEAPDIVTLNEICENDVHDLVPALAGAHLGGQVITAFQSDSSSRTGDTVHCRNGRAYGIGILAYLPGPVAFRRHSGLYPMQEHRGENRVWLCVEAPPYFSACTTHLADDTRSVALAQCEYLLSTVVPPLREADPTAPVVVGGDLNLLPPAAGPCLPAGYARRDDGGLQEIMSSPELTVVAYQTIDPRGATDHPGLLVTLRLPVRQ
jgi:endonuclease/exonuclease/phosphatase family metal-dependent hydrolase